MIAALCAGHPSFQVVEDHSGSGVHGEVDRNGGDDAQRADKDEDREGSES